MLLLIVNHWILPINLKSANQKIRSTHFFVPRRRNLLGCFTALHMSPFNFKDLSSQCFTQWLTGSYLGQHTGLFSREVGKKNYRPKHKYCGAQTAVPPVLTAALGLIETHPGEQQRRKTAHTLLFTAEESLLKNRKQEEIQLKFYAARNTICSLNP